MAKFMIASVISFVVIGISFSQQQDTTAVDSLLVRQLTEQMTYATQDMQMSQHHMAQRSTPSTNPDLSAIGDFRSSYASSGDRRFEAYLNEVEFQVASVVDPYAREEFLFSFGKTAGTGELGIELEVGTVTSTFLPYGLQLTLGKFKPQFGKINALHPHYFSFIEFPRMISNFFESEGMFMEGASASWLVPNPLDFYQELVFEVGRAGSEPNESFVQGGGDKLLYAGHVKNFFDLNENESFELGLSALNGPNKTLLTTTIAGIDLTYKWKPLRFNTYRSFTWQNEFLVSRMKVNPNSVVQSYGAYSYIEHQMEKRWYVGVRYDYGGLPGVEGQRDQSGTLLLRFQPTEFQIIALQYQYIQRNYASDYGQITLRLISGIGTHGAHAY
jgi:hypothetical protein